MSQHACEEEVVGPSESSVRGILVAVELSQAWSGVNAKAFPKCQYGDGQKM